MRRFRKLRGFAFGLIGLSLAGVMAHIAVCNLTRISPPDSFGEAASGESAAKERELIREDGTARRFQHSYTRVRDGVREVYLEGTPEQIGTAQVTLLREPMIANETALFGDFAHFVPIGLARTLLTDIGRVRYRRVDQMIPETYRREIAAQAIGFQPDPFTDELPTFHRMVFLQSLYDIALSFEHSPLIGCSVFGLKENATKDGHVLIGRAFDFEANEIFDREKAIFFVRKEGSIPFASVAWPGLIGAVSGMNLEGVTVFVNGGRAREPRAIGTPVVHSLRRVLETAHNTTEAVTILKSLPPMVSHIVFVGDSAGNFAVVERAPGEEAHVRTTFADPMRVAVTNHFEGPLKDDPRNLAVIEKTTTRARRKRLDEILTGIEGVDPAKAVAILRDHECARGSAGPCELGDRRTIDALIATHGVVADATERALWVSAGPHLSGHFVRFDLREAFQTDHDLRRDAAPLRIADDPILSDDRYAQGRRRAGGPKLHGDGR